jgi:hypothetical protein
MFASKSWPGAVVSPRDVPDAVAPVAAVDAAGVADVGGERPRERDREDDAGHEHGSEFATRHWRAILSARVGPVGVG